MDEVEMKDDWENLTTLEHYANGYNESKPQDLDIELEIKDESSDDDDSNFGIELKGDEEGFWKFEIKKTNDNVDSSVMNRQSQLDKNCLNNQRANQRAMDKKNGEEIDLESKLKMMEDDEYMRRNQTDSRGHPLLQVDMIDKLNAEKKWFSCSDKGCSKRYCSIHSNGGAFKCRINGCGKEYRTKRSLISHMEKLHTNRLNERTFVCQINGCGEKFEQRWQLELEHMPTHSSHFMGDFNVWKLNSFKRQFIPEYQTKYACPHAGCAFYSYNYYNYNTHLVRDHEERSYKCDHVGCGDSFKSEADLTDHLNTHFNHQKQFQCKVFACEISFSTKEELYKHHLGIHSRSEEYIRTSRY